MQQILFPFEGVKQLPQAAEVLRADVAQQPRLPRHQVLVLGIVLIQRLAGQIQGRLQIAVDTAARILHFSQDLVLYPAQRLAGKALVDQSRCLPQLRLGEGPLGVDDAILHLALIDHQDDQHPVPGQGQKLYLAQLVGVRPRHGHQPGLSGDGRQQGGSGLHQFRRRFVGVELLPKGNHGALLNGLHL